MGDGGERFEAGRREGQRQADHEGQPEARGEAAEAATEGKEIDTGALYAEAETNIRYHKDREGFLEAWHRGLMLAVLLSGSGAILAVLEGCEVVRNGLVLIPTLAGALDMTFGFSRSARDHSILARRSGEISADISAGDGRRSYGDLRRAMEGVCMDDGIAFKAAQAFSHNETARVTGSAADQQIPLKRRHVWFRNYCRFSGSSFDTIEAIKLAEKNARA